MAQTPCIRVQAGSIIPDPTAATRLPGDVYVLGGLPLVVMPTDPNQPGLNNLDTESVFDVPKNNGAFAAGDAVYWNSTGNPVLGTAGSGCATSAAAGNNLMGFATAASAAGANYVRVKLVAAKRTATGAMPRIPTATVAAAGSAQADGGALIEGFNLVSGADGTKGVVLPSAVAGAQVIVKCNAAAILKVWPAAGNAINALAVNSAMSFPSGLVDAIFVAYDATTWYSLPLLPS